MKTIGALKSINLPASLQIVILVLCMFFGSASKASGEEPVVRPILVHHGSSARPWNFSPDAIAHIDGLPFSGIALNLPSTWLAMNSTEYGPFTEQDIRNQFGDLDFSFQSVNQNWVSVVVRRNGLLPEDGDFFDDAAWATTIDQLRLLAKVSSEPKYQCVGIMFDNEEYFEQVWNYPDDVAYANIYSLQDYQDKAKQRGREIFQAMSAEWPDIKIIFMHGPYRSAPEDSLLKSP